MNDTPRFDRCPDCPVRDGACWARRKNLPGLCAHPGHRARLAEWGAEGGPDTAPHPDAPAGSYSALTPPAVRPPAPARDPSDRRPRACLVTPSLNIGGADRWMIALMASTAHRIRWTGVACTADYHVVPAIRAEAEALAPVTVGEEHVAPTLAGADVAIVWGTSLARIASLVGSGPAAKVVAVSHGVGDWTRNLFVESHRAAVLVGVSAASLRTFPESDRSRAVVIENRVEVERLEPRSSREATRSAWGLAPGEKALVQVGRLSPEKNPKAFADAVAALHRMGRTEWRAVHVGTGWTEAEVRAHADEVAPGLVRFPGTTDDVASAYLAADALALPSSEEACSLMQIESLWVGAPIIASTVGLTEEPEIAALCRTVTPGCSGEELAAAVLADEADPDGTRARAARGMAVARERFAPARFAERWADLIERTARPPRKAPAAPKPIAPAAYRDALALYNSLTAAEQDAARDCPHKRREPVKSCCGAEIPGDVCRGGSRDGAAVQVFHCAQCVLSRRS